MTIVEAIKAVLTDEPEGLTSKEIYDQIIQQNLYVFGAKNPLGVVNGQIRRRCEGLDFPTAYPVKSFRISGHKGKKNKFALIDEENVGADGSAGLITKDATEYLPEEKIGAALQEHLIAIKQQVLDCIINSDPKFFEHLVVELLLKMGYGYGKESGIVTGKSHDGGIDGIISEDKLGLDLIYIQAKRRAVNIKVGSKEVQAFVGAMVHVNKGVFITTSSFTREAIDYIKKQQQKSVKLINGQLLSELAVKYEVGVLPAQTVTIYKIDTDYFRDRKSVV